MRISDWSSDVFSSDLPGRCGRDRPGLCRLAQRKPDSETLHQRRAGPPDHGPNTRLLPHMAKPDRNRSEERSVGKKCVSTSSSRWPPENYTNNTPTTHSYIIHKNKKTPNPPQKN